MQTNTRPHKYSTHVTPLSTRLCGMLLVPVIKTKPMRKWCKWSLTKEIILCMRVSTQQQQQTAPLVGPAAPLTHQELDQKTHLLFARICAAISDLVNPRRGLAPLGICPLNTRARSTAAERGMFSRAHAVDTLLFRRDAGWCLCNGVECVSPVETLQFYFRPSHTQWEPSRNVSPRNCSASGPCEISARL